MANNEVTSLKIKQPMQKNEKFRNSGIEILRIIAMMQIVFLHLYLYGGYKNISEAIGPRHFLASRFIWIFCRTPVNVFILISGYFMINKPFELKNNYKKIPDLYYKVLFYSLSIPLIFYILNPEALGNWPAIKSFLPFLSRTWYFISLYLIIMLLAPFVNASLKELDKKQYRVLLAICFFLFSVWPNLSSLTPVSKIISIWRVINTEEGKSLYSFLFMYIIGGYIRRFVSKPNKIQFQYLLLFILLSIVDFLLFTFSHEDNGGYIKLFGRFDNPFIILESVMILMFFRSINFKSFIINKIASATLGVYLIHEHRVMRNWLWNLFGTHKKSFYNNNLYFIKLLLIVVLVFVICCLIELLRQQLFCLIVTVIKKFKRSLCSKHHS